MIYAQFPVGEVICLNFQESLFTFQYTMIPQHIEMFSKIRTKTKWLQIMFSGKKISVSEVWSQFPRNLFSEPGK